MARTGDVELESRLARVESALSALAERVDQIAQAPRTDPARGRYTPPFGRDRPAPEGASTQRHSSAAPDTAPARPWFTTKSAEWWLGRLGIVFVALALILLYRYAVDRNWITPLLRVVAGVIAGGGLLFAGTRVARAEAGQPPDDAGLRELLLGGGLAAWYITSYAAAVYYDLISVPTARLIFLVLSVISAVLAIGERRALFGLVAVGVGFVAPFFLPSPVTSMVAFSLYIAALTSLGLLLYLLRGWQSVLWVTFLATWGTLAVASNELITRGSVSLTLLVIAVTAGFVRVPAMRRRLIALGSERCLPAAPSRFADALVNATNSLAQTIGGKVTRTDSPALWIMAIVSPLLMISVESDRWPAVSNIAWGGIAFALGVVAFRLGQRPSTRDPELTHLEMTAAVTWTLAGLLWGADRIGIAFGLEAGSLALSLAALHAAVTIRFGPTGSLLAPRAVAFVTAGFALLVVLSNELVIAANRQTPWEWTAAELLVLGTVALIWKRFRVEPVYRPIAIGFGLGAYLALLAIAGRVLGDIWQPLVTTSYAVAGVVLLVLSKRVESGAILRKLGGLTMAIVSVRLFIVDLAGVDTIWRVLLFFLCGLLFLYSSHRLRPGNVTGSGFAPD